MRDHNIQFEMRKSKDGLYKFYRPFEKKHCCVCIVIKCYNQNIKPFKYGTSIKNVALNPKINMDQC